MKSKTSYLYDKEADIFYISNGKPKKSDISDEVDDGVVARFDPKTKDVRGLTILNFSKRASKNSENLNLPFGIAFAV
jgi:uncharacterized protein YuzE